MYPNALLSRRFILSSAYHRIGAESCFATPSCAHNRTTKKPVYMEIFGLGSAH